MSYDPTVWKYGDKVTSFKLNKIENGLAGSYDEIARLDGDIDGLADDLDNEVAALRSQIGSPLVANTAEEMTNINKVYVYTGSETGYTAGHWYYFNGTAWADGGVYNSVAVQTDKTLTVPDMPADAKATGDEIGALKEDLSDKLSYLGFAETTPTLTWTYGYYTATLGWNDFENAQTSNAIHLNAGEAIKVSARVYSNTQCVMVKTSSDGTPIEPIYLGDGSYNEYVYTASSDCYVRFTTWVASGYSCVILSYPPQNFADEYDNNATYEVGDYCVYKNRFYVCSSPITTAENFNLAHWTFLTVGDALKILSTEIDDVSSAVGISEETPTSLTFTNGYYYTSLGWESSEVAITSSPIHLNVGDTIDLWARAYASSQCTLLKTDRNGVPYEYIAVGDGTYKEYIYTATEECYVIFTAWVSTGYSCTIKRVPQKNPKTYIVSKDGNADFTSFTDALTTLNNAEPKIIYIENGIYDIFDELGGENYIATIDPSTATWRDVAPVVPPNTHIIGRGNVTLKFTPTAEQIGSDAMAFLFSPLNVSGNCIIENIHIEASNCRYAIHDEEGALAKFDDAVHIYKNVTAHKEHGTYGLYPTFASGIGARSRWYFEDCIFKNDLGVSWTAHTTKSEADDMALIDFKNCIFEKDDGTAYNGMVQFITGGGNHLATKNKVFMTGCFVNGSVVLSTGGASGLTQRYAVTAVGNKIVSGITVDPGFDSNPYIPEVYAPL